MNTILALKGRGNSGKTTTIGILHNLLLQNGYHQSSSNFNSLGRDFSAVFTKEGKKLGITSSGDTYDLVLSRLQELVDANCDVCICACRTFGGTHTAIAEFVNYNNEFVEKTIDNNIAHHQRVNSADAHVLLNRINALM